MLKQNLILLIIILLFSNNNIESKDECYEFDEYKYHICSNIKLADENKQCSFINNECKEQPKECSLYTGENAEECESIIPTSLYSYASNKKCVFKNGKCEEESKTCSDYKKGQPEEFCVNINSLDYQCTLVNGNCVENHNYYSCSQYEGDDSNICESINLYNPFKKCKLKDGICSEEVKTRLSCSDYKTEQDSDYCNKIILDDKDKYCNLIGYECKEFYKECSSYQGNSQEECELNVPKDKSYKCVYKDGKCQEVNKECSDGRDSDSCEVIEPNDDDKSCIFTENQCKEVYTDCNKGNEETCSSIIPGDDKKCVYENGVCKKVYKECKDYKKGEYISDFCEDIDLDSDTKYCRFFNHECQEHYRKCSDYTGGEKNICESIITRDYLKCKLDDNGNCKEIQYQCSDLPKLLDNLNSEKCENITPTNRKKKCVYSKSNYKCIEEDKTCSDYTKYATNDICSNAKTSGSGNECVLDEGKDKCVEKSERENYGKKNKIKLFLIVLTLFVLM